MRAKRTMAHGHCRRLADAACGCDACEGNGARSMWPWEPPQLDSPTAEGNGSQRAASAARRSVAPRASRSRSGARIRTSSLRASSSWQLKRIAARLPEQHVLLVSGAAFARDSACGPGSAPRQHGGGLQALFVSSRLAAHSPGMLSLVGRERIVEIASRAPRDGTTSSSRLKRSDP